LTEFWAAFRNWTEDLRFTIPLLYQLS